MVDQPATAADRMRHADTQAHILAASKACKNRMDCIEIHLKGKRRDDATIHFMCGYANALLALDMKEVLGGFGVWLSMCIAVRGFAEVVEVVRKGEVK